MGNFTSTHKMRLNLAIKGKRTSLALESGVWETLTEICRREEQSLDELCEEIVDKSAKDCSMASAIRIHALKYFKTLAA